MKVLVICLLVVALLASFSSGTSIVGYWGCNPGGHTSSLSQLQTALSKGYNVIIFAFYDVDANGGLNQDPGSVTPPKKSAIGNTSFKYLVSLFGGQNGAAPTLTLSANTWAQNMYNNFVTLHNTYGFDGIDIDLENAWGGTGDQVVCGLRYFFQLMHNAGYFVSMAPQTTALTPEVTSYSTGSWNSYAPLADTGIIQYVDIVATQLYNNAVPYNSPSSYANSLINGFQVSGSPSCPGVTGLVKIPASKIAFGYPASNGAAPSGCPGLSGGCPYGSALSSLYNGNTQLKQTGGVMTWSVEWDEAGGYQFVSAAKSISFTNGGSATVATATTAATSSATVATSASVTSSTATSSSSTTGAFTCSGKASGMYCISSSQFEWCPQNIIQSCGAGTVCQQSGTTIICGNP